MYPTEVMLLGLFYRYRFGKALMEIKASTLQSFMDTYWTLGKLVVLGVFAPVIHRLLIIIGLLRGPC